jgi:hypothetical protein
VLKLKEDVIKNGQCVHDSNNLPGALHISLEDGASLQIRLQKAGRGSEGSDVSGGGHVTNSEPC